MPNASEPSAGWSLQTAIHARLTGDATLGGLLAGPRVFDDVPRGAAFPYVTFGLTSEKDWSTGSENGSEHVVTLHVWSRAAGRHEARTIVAAIKAALHDQSLALAGHRLINLRQEFADAQRDADGETFHGIVRLRAVTEQLA